MLTHVIYLGMFQLTHNSVTSPKLILARTYRNRDDSFVTDDLSAASSSSWVALPMITTASPIQRASATSDPASMPNGHKRICCTPVFKEQELCCQMGRSS